MLTLVKINVRQHTFLHYPSVRGESCTFNSTDVQLCFKMRRGQYCVTEKDSLVTRYKGKSGCVEELVYHCVLTVLLKGSGWLQCCL